MPDDRYIEWLTPEPEQPDDVVRFRASRGFRGPPPTRFEVVVRKTGEGYQYLIGGRVVVSDLPRAWFRVDDRWSLGEVVLADDQNTPDVVPPIRSHDVETVADWTKWFAQHLATSVRSPLYPGEWLLGATRLASGRWRPSIGQRPGEWRPPDANPLDLTEVTDAVATFRLWGDVIPLRPMSPPDAGRIKWWRKVARRGALPPVLLYYCGVLTSYFVIDGHDRSLAAQLEGEVPSYVALVPIRRREKRDDPAHRRQIEQALLQELEKRPEEPGTVDGVNRALIDLYTREYLEIAGRAWPYPGGAEAWLDDVHEASGGRSAETRELVANMTHLPD